MDHTGCGQLGKKIIGQLLLHSIITFALRGERSPSKYKNMQTCGDGGWLYQCERLHINFLIVHQVHNLLIQVKIFSLVV